MEKAAILFIGPIRYEEGHFNEDHELLKSVLPIFDKYYNGIDNEFSQEEIEKDLYALSKIKYVETESDDLYKSLKMNNLNYIPTETNMKRVLYVMTSLSHKRVFETFVERDDIVQMMAGPVPKITGIPRGVVPEDYSDFKMKNIKLFKRNPEGLQIIVDNFKPDIYVQASLPCANNIVLPKGCKKVYVSHGMVGNHVKGIIKKAGFKTSVWKGCDLYCGATGVFADWVKHVVKVDDNKVLLNALPQLDILHDPSYYNSFRQRVLSKTNHPNAKKVILYAGFCCKERYDFNPHNEDYFRTAIELERIAKQNDWLVMIKPRQTYDAMMKFLKKQKWGHKYVDQYRNIRDSKHLHFITTTGHIYRYFFADAIVINGTSTIEVEACAIKKPLFIVRTCSTDRTDPYNMLRDGAAMSISDLSELEHDLTLHFRDGSFHYPDMQEKLIKGMGIKFDGKMHRRVQDRIARM